MTSQNAKYKYPTKWHYYVIRYRMPITLVISAGILILTVMQGHVPFALLDLSTVLGPLGLLLVLSGASLRSWAAGLIHKRESIARTGPYAFTRHPLYFGSLGIALGFTSIIGDWKLLGALVVITVLVYIPKITQEEKSLRQHYGDQYRSYQQDVGLCWPRRWPETLNAVPWSLHQWIRNREYLTFLSSLFGLLATTLWREFL